MINASPDLRAQIESFPALHPSPGSRRNSPLRDVFLTNADLDHILGLPLLREGTPLRVHATAAVRETLARHLRWDLLFGSFCGIDWKETIPGAWMPLMQGTLRSTGLRYRAIDLGGSPPPYARNPAFPGTHSVAYQFADERTGGQLLVAPDVASVPPALKEALLEADAVLFDGTFWSANELRPFRSNAPLAEDMGHLPIRGGSLDLLRGLKASRKIYLHINNTNPILAPDSPERAEVEKAGIEVGSDGLEFDL